MTSPARVALLLIAASLALAGCGRKGDPDYPARTQTQTVIGPDGEQKKEPVKPKRSFPLDPLLN